MGKKYPEIPTKKIIAAYEKNKGDIRAIVTDMIIDAIEIKGGAAACGPDEYASGDRCFKKQARPDTFDRDKFFADQKREADSKERRDDGMVKQNDAPDINVDMSTKRTADAAMPLPAPKPQDKNEKGLWALRPALVPYLTLLVICFNLIRDKIILKIINNLLIYHEEESRKTVRSETRF